MRGLIDGQLQLLRQIDERIAAIEGELQALERQLDSAHRVRQIPGVGLLGATALAAVLANKMARTAWALIAHGREYQAGGFAKASSPNT